MYDRLYDALGTFFVCSLLRETSIRSHLCHMFVQNLVIFSANFQEKQDSGKIKLSGFANYNAT